MEPRIGKLFLQIKRERCKLYDRQGFCSHWERYGTISAPQGNINSCSHCHGAIFETEQNGAQTYPVQCEHGLELKKKLKQQNKLEKRMLFYFL